MGKAKEIVRHGVVAAGHQATVEAATRILESGGNAFDSAAAAFFAACVAEPVLCSPGGGGFLLARSENDTVAYDFFNQTPLKKRAESDFYPILADFGDTQQEFHLGAGSWATPGALPGILAFQKELGLLPFKVVIEPAVVLAKKGVEVTEFTARLLTIVSAIYLNSEAGRELFGNPESSHKPLQAGQTFKPSKLADFFQDLADDSQDAEREMAHQISRSSQEMGGHLELEDFRSYRVYKRKPLKLKYRRGAIITNPAPSLGGTLIAIALELLKDYPLGEIRFGTALHLEILARVQTVINQYKRDFQKVDAAMWNRNPGAAKREALRKSLEHTLANHPTSLRGTTHISILDTAGNAAAMSISNGSGSGYVLPKFGFTMNNILGEEDLNPNGFHKWQPNRRLASMMAPTFIEEDGALFITGSGGSNRIRSAILQVISNLLDFDMDLKSAVKAPRIHCEHNVVNLEPGFPATSSAHLRSSFENLLEWEAKGLFFGGAHSVWHHVHNGYFGYEGDSRRAGEGKYI